MEVGRQSTAGIGHNGAGAHGRGRGRARVRVRPHHETENAIRHTGSDSHYNSGKMYGHFEDSFETSLVSVSDDTKLPTDKLVTSRYQSVDDKGQFSDKENSSASSNSSPKTQRSRRSHFDTGVMSRINNHLRQGMNERSDGGAAHSLDRKKGPPSSSRLSRLGSPKLHLVIPADKTSGAQDAAAPCRKMAGGGGRPRSVTHPLPSPPGGGLLLEGAKPSEPGHVLAVASSQPLQAAQSQTTVSTPSVSSLARVKGRGRARGRARSRQQEMECSTFPGSAPGNGHDLDLQQTESHSQPEGLDRDRFADAHASVTDSPERVESAPRSEKAQSSSAGTGHAPSSAKELPTDRGARVASVDEGGRQTNKSDETSRTLTLKIDVDGRNTAAEGPEVYSPGLVDDITQLLSPDHEYTLDWAAAMETPTPDTSSDSAPVWNTSDLADDP